MGKKASARVKNKVKSIFVRSISKLEQSMNHGRSRFQARHSDKPKK